MMMVESASDQNRNPIGTPSADAVINLEAQRPIILTTNAANAKLQRRRPLLYTELAANFAIICVAGLLTLWALSWIGPYRRGFFCDDDTIRLPYKSSIVPVWMLLIYCLCAPLAVFAAGEFFRISKVKDECLGELELGEPRRMMRVLFRVIYFYGHYLIAFTATNIFTGIAKYPVGRLRPHFIDLCRPNVSIFCEDPKNWHKYIEEYVCTSGASTGQIAEARLSFFSGHSSLAMCASVFISIYLLARHAPLHRARFVVLVPLLQIGVLSLGMLIAYSRIQDHMHHSTDVLFGMISGGSIATFTALTIAGLQIVPASNGNLLIDGSNNSMGAKPSATTTVTESLDATVPC